MQKQTYGRGVHLTSTQCSEFESYGCNCSTRLPWNNNKGTKHSSFTSHSLGHPFFRSILSQPSKHERSQKSSKPKWTYLASSTAHGLHFVLILLRTPFINYFVFATVAIARKGELCRFQEDAQPFDDADFSLHHELARDVSGAVLFSSPANGLRTILWGRFDVYVGASLRITAALCLALVPKPFSRSSLDYIATLECQTISQSRHFLLFMLFHIP